MLSWTLVKYVMTAALRDRLMFALVLMVIVGGALSVFLGSSAIIEPDRFALVFAATGLRFAGAVGIILFIVFHIRRAFDSRDVEFLLSRPLSRTAFICSHSLAFSLLALIVSGVVTFSIFAVSPHSNSFGMLLWAVSLAAEFIIMANAALFFAMVLPSATAGALASIGLYVLGRLMGELLGIVYTGSYSHGYRFLALSMKIVSLIVPRLDLMGQSSWLVYGTAASTVGVGFVLAQGVVYSLLLASAALIDLVRRQF
ncbi:MAG TPA: hypothetical protein VL625_10490 [Patescibacteria group bacterium]|jgi:hypothetical protein|nr:hypothetical protein [Patescibacteria group bacterium]